MGLKERRDAEKTKMKRKIMKAAVNIIEKEGYEKLSIRKIAAEIEYSPTTIYLYYKDKGEIITDMSEELYNKVLSGAAAAINENTSWQTEEQIRNVMTIFIKELCSEPEMVKAIMFSGRNVIFANDNTGGRPSNPGIELLDNLISKGISHNVIRPNIKKASWMIVSALIGFVMSAIANQLQLHKDFDQLADDFITILMGGILCLSYGQ